MHKSKHIISLIIFSFLFITSLFSQDNNKSPLPNGFANIQLGMSVEDTKDELLKNSDFGYKGERDVSLVPDKQQVLIETNAQSGLGSNFLTTCYFQFYEDELYIISINMNKEKIDHYSIFKTLTNKYGEPKSVTPQKSIWQNDEITMTLEKPLTLKYINNKIQNQLLQYSTIQKSSEEITQQMFLDQL